MSTTQVRIISDLHYGDRVSAVHDLAQLAPLLEGTRTLLLNGDTTDTRPGPNPDVAVQVRAELDDFIRHASAEVRCLTGNHDPDITPHHHAEFANGTVLATHGDILFDNIVPWGRDAELAMDLVNQARLDSHPAGDELQRLLQAHRHAAARIPQRHQAERRGLQYFTSFVTDTLWPPSRIFHIVNSWRQFPARAKKLLDLHRPNARFFIGGHTHWPGIWQTRDGFVFINTGSYCPPCGRLMVDVAGDQLTVRNIRKHRGDFHPGNIIREFALTPPPVSPTHKP